MPQSGLTGRCVCGGVRFAIDGPLRAAGYCHCTRCQRRSGTAASAQAVLAPGQVTIATGADLVRRWQPETGNAKAFCATCGSQLFSFRPGEDEPASVRLGVLDSDPGVRPSFRQHVATAAVWEPVPDDGLPRHEGSRSA